MAPPGRIVVVISRIQRPEPDLAAAVLQDLEFGGNSFCGPGVRFAGQADHVNESLQPVWQGNEQPHDTRLRNPPDLSPDLRSLRQKTPGGGQAAAIRTHVSESAIRSRPSKSSTPRVVLRRHKAKPCAQVVGMPMALPPPNTVVGRGRGDRQPSEQPTRGKLPRLISHSARVRPCNDERVREAHRRNRRVGRVQRAVPTSSTYSRSNRCRCPRSCEPAPEHENSRRSPSRRWHWNHRA